MEKQTFQVTQNPTLSITECARDLLVLGWPRPVIELQADSTRIDARQEGDTLMVTCQTDLQVRAPHGTTVKIHNVGGDAQIKHIAGEITLGSVHGDLALNRVGPVQVEVANGDLAVRLVDGDLTVGSANGDMSARRVAGRLQVGTVQRDLGLRDLGAGASTTHVHGDIRLRTSFLAGHDYTFKADGDVVARIPAGADASLTLRSGRKSIRIKGELADMLESDRETTGRLGDGSATVTLEAGRDLVLVTFDDEQDWDGLGAEFDADLGIEFANLANEIAAQIESQMAEVSLQLEAKLARIDERAVRAAEKAQRHAEQAADRLRRAAERQAERSRRKAHWRVTRASSGRPAQAEAAKDPISDNERLAILNLVAEGKISVEEAERLLDALNT